MPLKLLLIPLLCTLGFSPLSATSLKQVVTEVLDTNPVIIERLRNYRVDQYLVGSVHRPDKVLFIEQPVVLEEKNHQNKNTKFFGGIL